MLMQTYLNLADPKDDWRRGDYNVKGLYLEQHNEGLTDYYTRFFLDFSAATSESHQGSGGDVTRAG